MRRVIRDRIGARRSNRHYGVLGEWFAVKNGANDSDQNGYMYFRGFCSITVMAAGSAERGPIRLQGSLSSEALDLTLCYADPRIALPRRR